MKTTISGALLAATLLLAAPASAKEPRVAKVKHWYGWQTLTADAVSLGTVTAGLLVGPNSGSGLTLMGTGAAGWVLASPIVHWSHGHVGRGFASLGLRVVAPAATALVWGGGALLAGCAAGCEGEGSYGAGLVVVLLGSAGFVAGVAAATALDSVLLANEQVDAEDPQPTPGKLTIYPTGGYEPKTQTASVGLGGIF